KVYSPLGFREREKQDRRLRIGHPPEPNAQIRCRARTSLTSHVRGNEVGLATFSGTSAPRGHGRGPALGNLLGCSSIATNVRGS
ncbi:MAG: hypothetical protein ACREBC_31445, partial [Pyrinomonadaceae bacterium]